MSYNQNLFDSLHSLPLPIDIYLPNGSKQQVQKWGTVILSDKIILHKVLFVPEFKHNLLSVAQLVQEHSI